jgi:hypothetical protein
MKKTVAALVAVATIGGSLMAGTPAAQADGRGVAAGVAAGLIGGAIVGGAIAASRPAPVYGEPAYVAGPPAPPPGCYWSRERFWDGYGWRSRPVQVCN